jgi:hypothetical protein
MVSAACRWWRKTMPENQEPIDKLVINSAPVPFRSATLRRDQAALPSGAPGSSAWRVEIVDADLPQMRQTVLVEMSTDEASYSGAARVLDEGLDAERLTLIGNGPLLVGRPGPELD